MALNAQWAALWIAQSAAVIAENKDLLMTLDREIGDADHGENMDRGFKAAAAKVNESEFDSPGGVLKLAATTLMSTVGGASGPLYGTAFLRAAKAVSNTELDGNDVVALLSAGLDGIKVRGKATVGEKTMVDAWQPAVEAARAALEQGAAPVAILQAAALAAAQGAEATIDLRATKGRASYLGERSIGHKDPGATSSHLILKSAVTAAMEGESK